MQERRRSRKSGVLSREDLKLWAHVTQSVTPFKGKIRPLMPEEPVIPETVPPSPPKSVAPKPAEPKPRTLPPLAPLERRMRQRVSRGQRPVDAVMDLHGMRQAEAHGALLHFIHQAHLRGDGLVLVVTGKGSSSLKTAMGEERGVLRRLVPHWLADPVVRRFVIGFEEAARGHGGDGALYVRIRRTRET